MRLENPSQIEKAEVLNILNKGGHVTIQFSEQLYNNTILSEINELCMLNDDGNLEIRFYGHGKKLFDATTLNRIRNVKFLSLGELTSVKNISELKNLKHLVRLTLNISELSDLRLLEYDNFKFLRKLSIVVNERKPLDISPLSDYSLLNTLFVYGLPKNPNTIGNIPSLKKLDLWRFKKNCSLDFINNLSQ